MKPVAELINRFNDVIINPTLALIFAAGLLLFIWGLVKFLFNLGEGENQEGKNHMLWGIVGMVVMLSVYGILAILDNTFNLRSTNPDMTRMQNIAPVANFFAPGR